MNKKTPSATETAAGGEVECERRYNIGCASAVAKALKIQWHEETDEELRAWETGETE